MSFRALQDAACSATSLIRGTQVILDYGRQHMETGDLIVYTSADSVFQIAAHEDIVPLSKSSMVSAALPAVCSKANLPSAEL